MAGAGQLAGQPLLLVLGCRDSLDVVAADDHHIGVLLPDPEGDLVRFGLGEGFASLLGCGSDPVAEKPLDFGVVCAVLDDVWEGCDFLPVQRVGEFVVHGRVWRLSRWW